MAAIPVSHVTEAPGGIAMPWVVRCQVCGTEVARMDQAELTAMVTTEQVDPVLCFNCEINQFIDYDNRPGHQPRQFDLAPWPTISVPRSLMGLV